MLRDYIASAILGSIYYGNVCASYNPDDFNKLSQTGTVSKGNLVGANLTEAYQNYRTIFEKSYSQLSESQRPPFQFIIEDTDISQATMHELFNAENISFINCVAHKVAAHSVHIDRLIVQGGEWTRCSLHGGKLSSARFSTHMHNNTIQGMHISSSKIQNGTVSNNSFYFCTMLGLSIVNSTLIDNLCSNCANDTMIIEGINTIRGSSIKQ